MGSHDDQPNRPSVRPSVEKEKKKEAASYFMGNKGPLGSLGCRRGGTRTRYPLSARRRDRETGRQQTTGILKAKQEIINCMESGVRDSEETTPKFVFSFCMKELAKRLAANEATTPAIGISATCGEDEFAWDAAGEGHARRRNKRPGHRQFFAENHQEMGGRESRLVIFQFSG